MSQSHTEHVASFNQGVVHGKNIIFNELYHSTDKHQFLKALGARVRQELENPNCSEQQKNQLIGMAHGLRVARLILDNLGDSVAAYNNIIKPDIQLTFTHEDMKKV